MLDLTKREKTLTLCLTKKKIAKIVAQVATAIDRSGSMNPLYRNGTVQEYVNRLIPIGLKFDDNGQVDNWAFHEEVFETGPITRENVENFVATAILPIAAGGTSYAPVLKAVEEHYFGTPSEASKKPGLLGRLFGSKPEPEVQVVKSQDPVYLIFQTDGENDDQSDTDRMLGRLESQGIYVQFVGVGTDTSFGFIQKMGDKYSNVGFMHVKDLASTSDEELYDMLINEEFKAFLKSRFPNNIQEI